MSSAIDNLKETVMSTFPSPGGPGPVRPRQGAALLFAFALASAIGIAAAALVTRPDIPVPLRDGLSVAGSVFAGVMLIIPVVLALL